MRILERRNLTLAEWDALPEVEQELYYDYELDKEITLDEVMEQQKDKDGKIPWELFLRYLDLRL